MVYIYDRLDRESGRTGYCNYGDFHNVTMANIDIDLIVHMIDLLEKYYPFGHKLILILDVPKNLKEAAVTFFEQMTIMKKVTHFGGPQEVQKVVEDKYLPDYFKTTSNKD